MKRSILICVVLCLCLAQLAGCGADRPAPAIRPATGGFQGNNEPQTFKLLLIVSKSGGDIIEDVQLFCAPGGQISLWDHFSVAEQVKVDSGKFTADSQDIAITGRFTSPIEAQGSIRALSDVARHCGVPEEGQWIAKCDLAVAQQGDGYTLRPIDSGTCPIQ